MPRFYLSLLFLATLHAQPQPAQPPLCDPAKFQGAFGFLLTGHTTISADSKPVASSGRLIFDGHGAISGQASVNFAGYLLGNPVTGTYSAQPDCSLTYELQDDSGAHQHFAAQFTADWSRAQFRQTDPGGAQSGTLAPIAARCTAAALAPAYSFTLSGSTTPMNPGETARAIRAAGRLTHAENGALLLAVESGPPVAVDVHIDSDCVVELSVPLPAGPVALRGVLVNNGRDILAIATDAGAAVTARFTILNVSQ